MAILGDRVAQQQYLIRKEALDKQEFALKDAEREHRRYRMWFIASLIIMAGLYYLTNIQDVFEIEKVKKDTSMEYALFMGGFTMVMVWVYVTYAVIIQSGIREIIYNSDKYADTPSIRASKRMLDAAGVKYRQYEAGGRFIELHL